MHIGQLPLQAPLNPEDGVQGMMIKGLFLQEMRRMLAGAFYESLGTGEDGQIKGKGRGRPPSDHAAVIFPEDEHLQVNHVVDYIPRMHLGPGQAAVYIHFLRPYSWQTVRLMMPTTLSRKPGLWPRVRPPAAAKRYDVESATRLGIKRQPAQTRPRRLNQGRKPWMPNLVAGHHIVTFEAAGGLTLGHKHGFLLSVLGISGRTVAMVLTGEDGQIKGKGRGRPFLEPGEAIAPLPSAAILNTVFEGIMTKAFLFANMSKIYGRCIS